MEVELTTCLSWIFMVELGAMRPCHPCNHVVFQGVYINQRAFSFQFPHPGTHGRAVGSCFLAGAAQVAHVARRPWE